MPGPSKEAQDLFRELGEIWRRLDDAQAGLPNDALYAGVYNDLREALAAIERAQEKLQLSE
jgi:hypothetical protein